MAYYNTCPINITRLRKKISGLGYFPLFMEIFTFCCTYFKMMLMYDILCVSSCYNNIHTSIKNEIGFLPPSHDHIKNMIKPVSLRAKTLPLCASICDDKCPIL